MKMYQVPEDQLIELLENQMLCNALQAGGVDNWDWYGESISDFIEEEKQEFPSLKDDPDVYLEDIAEESLKQYKVVRED